MAMTIQNKSFVATIQYLIQLKRGSDDYLVWLKYGIT